MTIWEPLRDAILSARGQSERGIDTPLVAAADGGEVDMFEVNGKRWPRRADVRGAAFTEEKQAFERESGLELQRLRAQVSDASEAQNRRRRELDAAHQAVGQYIRLDIERELTEALAPAWAAFRSSGSTADAATVAAALVHAEERELHEYGSTSTFLTGGVFVRVVCGARPEAGAPYGLAEACSRALKVAHSGGSPVALVRELAEVERLCVPLS